MVVRLRCRHPHKYRRALKPFKGHRKIYPRHQCLRTQPSPDFNGDPIKSQCPCCSNGYHRHQWSNTSSQAGFPKGLKDHLMANRAVYTAFRLNSKVYMDPEVHTLPKAAHNKCLGVNRLLHHQASIGMEACCHTGPSLLYNMGLHHLWAYHLAEIICHFHHSK